MAPDPAVTSGMPTHEALALLPIPKRLTDQQREGRACVWGGEPITALTSSDLGSRTVEDRRIFPRGCPQCVGKAAMGALFDHSTGPDACADCKSTPICNVGRALNLIIRGATR